VLMQANRGTTKLLDLTRGPGRVAAALQITREHDGIDLTASQTLWLGELVPLPSEDARRAASIGATVRIGITRAADHQLRFYERGNPFVSGPKHLLARVRVGAKTWNGERTKRRAPR
jgi:DNA-3-methyladenine glycosylase